VLIALEFDLFVNADGRSAQEVRIETNEALLLGTLLALGLLVFSIRRFSEQKREMALRIEAEIRARKALELALLDPLTGLANRRHFDDIFGAAAARRSQASQIAQPISIEGQIHRVSTSVGFALFPSEGIAASEVFQQADAALYAAKAAKVPANIRKAG
jgi:GGDEF domain-containing protein